MHDFFHLFRLFSTSVLMKLFFAMRCSVYSVLSVPNNKYYCQSINLISNFIYVIIKSGLFYELQWKCIYIQSENDVCFGRMAKEMLLKKGKITKRQINKYEKNRYSVHSRKRVDIKNCRYFIAYQIAAIKTNLQSVVNSILLQRHGNIGCVYSNTIIIQCNLKKKMEQK